MYAESSTPTVPCSVFVCRSISETDVALQPCQKELLHVMIHVRFKLNKVYTMSIKPLPSWPPSCSSAFSLFVRSFSFVLSLFLFMFIIFFFYSLCLCPLHFTMFLFLWLFRASWTFAFPPFSKTYKTSSSPKRDFQWFSCTIHTIHSINSTSSLSKIEKAEQSRAPSCRIQDTCLILERTGYVPACTFVLCCCVFFTLHLFPCSSSVSSLLFYPLFFLPLCFMFFLFPVLLYFLVASLPFLGQGERAMARRQNGYSRVWCRLYTLYNLSSSVSSFQPLQLPFKFCYLFSFSFCTSCSNCLLLVLFRCSIPFPCPPLSSSLSSPSSFSLLMLLFFRICSWSSSSPEGMRLQTGNMKMKMEHTHTMWNRKMNIGHAKDK